MLRPLGYLMLTRVSLSLAAVMMSVAQARAGDAPQTGFEQGNALYANGRYAEAAQAYESAVQAGANSANLFYNLGNADERLGQRGRSMLNYQRALLLDPAHAEARANLAYVQGGAGGRSSSVAAWLSRTLGLADIDLCSILAAAAGWLGLLCLAIGASSRWRRTLVAALCFAVCAAAVGAAWRLDDGLKNAGRAVVLTDRARALYSPADNSKVMTNLPCGSEVRVLSEHGTWIYARLPDGTRSWVAAANVEKVVPPSK